MSNTFQGGIQVVKVTRTDHKPGEMPTVELWAAATSRDVAVEAIKRGVPPGCHVELTDQDLAPEHAQRLRLVRPDDVREITS